MHLDTPERKLKEPQRDLQPTDIDQKLIAYRRKAAGQNRSGGRPTMAQPTRPSNPPPAPPVAVQNTRPLPPTSPRKAPQPTASRPSPDADHEDFSRRLKISSPPSRPAQAARPSKLFNPETDPIPIRRTAEPEPMSEANMTYAPRAGPSHHQRDAPTRQLFDHKKDDPVRFSVMARPSGRPTPTPKSSGDHASIASSSSYAPSVSSSFTLSSTTDGSSASSALFDRQGQQPNDESGTNAFAVQLKKLYRAITNLETKIKQEDQDEGEDAGRIMLKGKEVENVELEKEKWRKQIEDHKQLAEIIHSLLEISLAPSVPASLRNIPVKYNIIVRLWTYAFHKLLESLRRASFTSTLALEHLQDFIYYAYTFYTGLLEEPALNSFKGGWLEALGDLARYRMAVAAMVTGNVGSGNALTTAAVSKAAADVGTTSAHTTTLEVPSAAGLKSNSNGPALARIDDSPSPSVGVAAARLLDVEPEKERWRGIARDWYGAGLADQPGTGKLHHHLGLLSREVEGEELRGVYHFVKSMTTLHPFMTSRESVLPIWSGPSQARRSLPDARVPDLFVLLHGMLFTNIQLDDFQPTLARFVERLQIEGAEEREWIMMAVVNISAILEYGKPAGVMKSAGGVGTRAGDLGTQQGATMKVMAKKVSDEEKMDVDEAGGRVGAEAMQSSPPMSEVEPDTPDYPPSFKFALQLTFAMLSHVLRHPTRQPTPYTRTVNPYLTVILTFLTTVLKNPATLEILERSVPWEELAGFFATVPRKIMSDQGLFAVPVKHDVERWAMLTSGCAPPLAEDWCLRGMEWVGRKVFERGFWKSGEETRAEIEVLGASEDGRDMTDGRIEDDDGREEDDNARKAERLPGYGRWVRIVRSAVGIAGIVNGFEWVAGTRDWKVTGRLAEKVQRWQEQDRVEREEEERRRMGRRWTEDAMDVDADGVDDGDASESSEDDENDTEEVKALKARRRYLQSLVRSAQRGTSAVSQRRPHPRSARRAVDNRPPLPIVAGYTILVVDTNILLSSLSMFASMVESHRWTVIVPLPVVMELDGLSSNPSPQLSEAAQAALSYITSNIRTYSMSLKVQTSRGNYLSSLNVRTEQVDFTDGNAERNMDDLILKAAIWQDEHWVDRSALLKDNSATMKDAVKVVLLTLDRNLRLKARSRQLPAASETDLASILTTGT